MNQESRNKQPRSASACAREVVAQEIAGLEALNSIFDTQFDSFVEQVAQGSGRVIVSGMGKSGHVARKIAATLASTGTPAMFVHPSEASHGDLGMITPDDLVICLSNSGETAELRDVIAYTRRFSIPLVALVRRKTSILTEAANVAFVLPEVPEASLVGAPTTSTTMMLAFGDALAMALLEHKGFTKENFGTFHPGGKLGAAFIQVKDLMHQGDSLPLVSENTLMSEAILTMTNKHFGCLGVVDENNKLLGVVTDGDLRRHMSGELLQKPVTQVMSAGAIVLHEQQLAAEALGLMNDKSITCVFVVKEQEPIGILHVHDCLRAGVM